MINLDSKDFKILYELFLNSRQSSLKISKKTGVNQSVVKYRIKKLEAAKIIQDYCINPNFKKIGYYHYRLYISLQFASPGKEKEIVEYFQQKKNTWRVESCQGKYDILLSILIKNSDDFILFYKDIMDKFSDYFKKISISQSYEMFGFGSTPFKKEDPKNSTQNFQVNPSKANELDAVNKKILYLLNKNARIPVIKIAQHAKISVPTVISHIKNLEQNGIIKNYSVIIDGKKVGFKRFLICFTFVNYKKINPIIHYFSLNSYIEEIHKVIGEYHLEIILHTTTLEHFHAIMEDFRSKYSNDLKDYEYSIINKVYTHPSQSAIFK